ncbi:MAG: class II fructose-bisphosphate aldolase [Clostridia bacterium]|nr:class II fructose-bisphosphate aldolase [Clostridia bacterium]
MIAGLRDILKMAEEKKCAIGAFNTPNLECVNAVLDAAQALNVPVILAHAQLHEEISPLKTIGPVMVQEKETYRPRAFMHDKYERIYERYKELYRAVRPLMNE